MSPAQIAAERQELMDSISPSFLQKLLLRADINSGSAEQDLESSFHSEQVSEAQLKPEAQMKSSKPAKSVSFAVESQEPQQAQLVASAEKNIPTNDPAVKTDEVDVEVPDELGDASNVASNVDLLPPTDSIHFPQPTQPPSLDPSSSTFFEDLHSKYFPSLPADPAKLSWMQPATAAEASAYAADAPALAAASIRFDFAGALIPPRLAAEIPVSAGLHHHAEAPAAAGYTVAELAHLARSTVPAQRCIAFQTLGRVLYRLGRGEFGNPSAENVVTQPGDELSPDEGPDPAAFSELAQGLWREVERCQVVPNLVQESEGQGVDGGRHVSAKAYATEAVWLWRKGGGRRWKAY